MALTSGITQRNVPRRSYGSHVPDSSGEWDCGAFAGVLYSKTNPTITIVSRCRDRLAATQQLHVDGTRIRLAALS